MATACLWRKTHAVEDKREGTMVDSGVESEEKRFSGRSEEFTSDYGQICLVQKVQPISCHTIKSVSQGRNDVKIQSKVPQTGHDLPRSTMSREAKIEAGDVFHRSPRR